MGWVRPKKLYGLATISEFKVNFHQPFVANMQSDLFQGRRDGDIFYWPNQSGKLRCPNKKKNEAVAVACVFTMMLCLCK